MNTDKRHAAITEKIDSDAYARMLGATVEEIAPGYSRVSLTVTDDMLNFHGVTHGGLLFSLGDIAFAAASNSRGQTAVALNVSTAFLKSTQSGARLVAEAREKHLQGSIGLYDITISDARDDTLVARTQATVYRKRDFFVPPAGTIG